MAEDEGKKSIVVAVRLTPVQIAVLEAAAQKLGVTRSRAHLQALKLGLNQMLGPEKVRTIRDKEQADG